MTSSSTRAYLRVHTMRRPKRPGADYAAARGHIRSGPGVAMERAEAEPDVVGYDAQAAAKAKRARKQARRAALAGRPS